MSNDADDVDLGDDRYYPDGTLMPPPTPEDMITRLRDDMLSSVKKVYISGPISGIPGGNREAFLAAELVLQASGYDVVNPQKLVPRMLGEENEEDWAGCMRLAIRLLLDCDQIYLLDGWFRSRGAQVEHGVAVALGMHIVTQQELHGVAR